MKSIFLALAFALAVGIAVAQNPTGPTSQAGRYTVSEYANWILRTMNNVNAGSQTVYVDQCYPNLGTNVTQFFPLATNAPLTISDGANSETITPTQVNRPTNTKFGDLSTGQFTCSFVATFANPHLKNTAVTSATFGFEEAINAANNKGGGIAVIDASWPGTTSMITVTGLGFAGVTVEDNRLGSTSYSWNGVHYVTTSIPVPLSSGLCFQSTGNTLGAWLWGSCTGAGSSNWSGLTPGSGTIGTGSYHIGTGSTLDSNGGSIVATGLSGVLPPANGGTGSATALANTVFGNNTGSTAAPGFQSLVPAQIPNLDASKITTGTVATARLGSGTANSTTFLRGDQTYSAVSGLPSQTGFTPGSLLSTNGTSATWQAKPVCNTRDMTGADLGLRINQCAAQIGFTTTTIPGGFVAKYIGTPGTIRVDTADAGAISTQVIIPSNQTLSLGNGHFTNAFGDFIPPITLSDNSTLACDSWATQIDNTTQNVGENVIVGMTNAMVCSSPAPPPCGAGGCQVNCSYPPTVGVQVNSCHFKQSASGSASGSSLTGTVSLAQCQGCKVTNNWFDGIGTTAVTLVGTYTQFPTHPEWSYIFGHDDEIAGNLITGVSNAGISVINNENVDIHDNFFRDHGAGAAAYVDLESNSVLDHMQYIDVHNNRFDCSKAPANPAQCYGVTLQSVGPSVGHLKLHDNLLNGPLVAPGGYTVGGIGSVDFNAHGNNQVEIYNNQLSYTTTSPLSLAGGDNGSVHDNLLTCDNGGIQISPGVTSSTIASNVFSSPPLTSFTVTSVATTADNLTTVYTGTFTGGGSNGLANQTFTIAGFSNAINNGTFGATASTATTLTVTNTAGSSETHAATATTGCSSGLTGAQNVTKIFETDSTDDYNVFRDNVGAGQTITFGAHSRIIDTKAANLQTDAASQTFNIPTGFGSAIPGGIATSAITAPVLNGTGPTNVAICTGVLASATYDYIVTAVAANGAEAPSNEIAKSITVGQCALLGWTYAAGAASYNIYRGTASGNELLMANVLQGTLGYADPGGQTPGVAVPTSNGTGGVNNVNTIFSSGGHVLAVEHFNAAKTPALVEIYPQSTDKPNEGNAAVAGTVAWAAAQLTSGGLIQVHQGSYTVATTITLGTSGTQLSCDDNQSTIFTAGASFNSTMFKIGWAGTQRQGLAFTNCRLEGSSGNNSSGVLLAIRDTANVNIDRNNLNDAGTNAIVLDATASGAVYNRITNNNAAECRQECLVINGSSSDATDSIFYGNSFGGTITGDGTKPWVTVNGLGSLQFTHNHISGLTHTSCMNFTNGSQTDIVISSNEIENCPQHGLLLSGSSITVANNLFYNVGNSSANTYAAVYLQSASYVSVIGNSFRGQSTTKNGVFSDQGTQYDTISGNTFSGNTGFAISMLNAFAGGNTIGLNSYQNNGGTYTLGGSHYGPSGIVLQTVPTASAIPGELGFVGMTTTQLAAGTTPAITTAGTGGAVTWTYVIVPKDINGNASPAGSSGSTAVGNATLTTSNFNIITWQQVDGAYSYDVYRTAHGTTPATNGKIGNVLASSILTGSFTQNYVLNDKALAGDATTAPTLNNSGSGAFAGPLTAKTLDKQTFYADQYSGATIDVQVNACLADAQAASTFGPGGTCDARGLAGDFVTAAQITCGTVAGRPVTLLLPSSGRWAGGMTDTTSDTLLQYGGCSIIGSPASGLSNTFQIGATNSSSLHYIYETRSAGSDDYFYASGFAIANHNGGAFTGHVTASGIDSYLTGSADDSVWENMVFFGDLSTYVVKMYADCCSASIQHSQINGNFGSIPLFITSDGSGGVQGLNLTDLSIVHPLAGQADILITDTVNHASHVNIKGLYIETATGDTATAIIQLDGLGQLNASGIEFRAETASMTASGIAITATSNTVCNCEGLVFTNGGTGNWIFPHNAVNNNFTGQTVKTDSNTGIGNYGFYSSAPSTIGGLQMFFNNSLDNMSLGNTQIPSTASGNHNVSVDASLSAATSAFQDVCVGFAACGAYTTANGVTAVGVNAGTGGSAIDLVNCSFFGDGANASAAGLTNCGAFGAGARVTASNTYVLGNSSTTDVYFGSTASPVNPKAAIHPASVVIGDTGPFGSNLTSTSAACETSFAATTLGTGATTTDTGLNCLPANSIIDGVVARVTTTITAACTGWELGDATTPARFSSNNTTLTAGTTTDAAHIGTFNNTGIASATTGIWQAAAAKVRITCAGGNPGAGAIRVIVYYHTLTAPTS